MLMCVICDECHDWVNFISVSISMLVLCVLVKGIELLEEYRRRGRGGGMLQGCYFWVSSWNTVVVFPSVQQVPTHK